MLYVALGRNKPLFILHAIPLRRVSRLMPLVIANLGGLKTYSQREQQFFCFFADIPARQVVLFQS